MFEVGASSGPSVEPIPTHVTTWSVKPRRAAQLLNYGEMHAIIYRDIAMGNDYRKERIKHLTTLATGVFALTLTFHKDLIDGPIDAAALRSLMVGWGCLLVSLFSGITHLRKWEDFYLGYRDVGNALWGYHVAKDGLGREKATKKWHKAVRVAQAHQTDYRFWNLVQTGSLLLGMALLAISVGMSISTRPDAPVPAQAGAAPPAGQPP